MRFAGLNLRSKGLIPRNKENEKVKLNGVLPYERATLKNKFGAANSDKSDFTSLKNPFKIHFTLRSTNPTSRTPGRIY